MWGKAITALFGVFALIFLSAVISSIFVWFGWNAVMPHLFKLPNIDIVQAFALSLVANSLIRQPSTSHTS